jgi:DNA repair photolyase
MFYRVAGASVKETSGVVVLKAIYREAICKSALTRVQGMPFQWSLNPFYGCTHACTYCYAREYHAKRERDFARGFDREIDVKINFVEVLRAELARGPKEGSVALGTSTDPYQAAEGRYRITRRTLEVLAERPMPLSIVTKSPMIVRDIDLLVTIDRRTRGDLRVYFSVGTVDPTVAALTEPDVAPPLKRLEAMRRLCERGIKAGVLCAPILPGLSDSEDSIEGVALAAAAHGAYHFHSRVLKLDPHVKEHYFGFLAREFPELLRAERARFANGVHPPRDYLREIERRVARVRARYRFPEDDEEEERAEEEQLGLAI